MRLCFRDCVVIVSQLNFRNFYLEKLSLDTVSLNNERNYSNCKLFVFTSAFNRGLGELVKMKPT